MKNLFFDISASIKTSGIYGRILMLIDAGWNWRFYEDERFAAAKSPDVLVVSLRTERVSQIYFYFVIYHGRR